MKLVLKYNDDVKLFTNSLDFDQIVSFACKEFNIRPDSLHISFLDEDNDEITILGNEDIEVMQALFDGKEYVKVNVNGEANAVQVQLPKIEEKKQIIPAEPMQEEKVEEVKIEPIEEKIEEPVKVNQEKAAEEPKESSEEKRQWGHHHGWKQRCFQKMECFLNEKVAQLVDQRVKALIPCLKEQILAQQPKNVELNGLTHEGVECKACLIKPIVGVRYECPTCPDFSLCQVCEEKIDHHHNLLKIKKIVDKKEQEKKGFSHCLGKLFNHHGHGHHHRRSSSSSREKGNWKGHHWHMRKCHGLSIMFGGKPEDYVSFVEENRHLRPRETFKRYADLQKMPEEEFRQRFIDMRCQKLSSNFGKPAKEYKAFVEENFQSRYWDLVHMLEEKGEKSQERRCRWGGKRFCFNENENEKMECSLKKEQVQVKPEKIEEPVKEEPKKEEPKQSEIAINDSQYVPKKESPEEVRQKGEILMQMQDIFGNEGTKEYFKFIDSHYKEGLEGVIQKWIEHINLSKIQR